MYLPLYPNKFNLMFDGKCYSRKEKSTEVRCWHLKEVDSKGVGTKCWIREVIQISINWSFDEACVEAMFINSGLLLFYGSIWFDLCCYFVLKIYSRLLC